MGKRPVLRFLIQLSLLTGAIIIAGLAAEHISKVASGHRVTVPGDPDGLTRNDMGSYTIRVMRNGTEAEISGGIGWGITAHFRKILDESPQIGVVHLYSNGGFTDEGIRLFSLIKERGLNTYVSSICQSACTLAFVGGRERFLAKGATLGFHRGTSGHSDDETTQFFLFSQAGFGSEFIRRVVATPSSEMWRPSADELLRANVITAVVDRGAFAPSGRNRSYEIENIWRAIQAYLGGS
jgi:hypothetical protein